MNKTDELNDSDRPYYQIRVGGEYFDLLCDGLGWRRASLLARSPTPGGELDRISLGESSDLPPEITQIADDWERWRETLSYIVLNDALSNASLVKKVDPLSPQAPSSEVPNMTADRWERYYLRCDENADEGVYGPPASQWDTW
jgi:hypothetical protein